MAAMIFIAFLLIVIIEDVNGLTLMAPREAHNDPTIPKPYFFSYDIKLNESGASNTRSESSDGYGRIEGSYRTQNDEGHYRIVKYTADENGFRASIETNEPGTGSQNPADVSINSKIDSHVNNPVLVTSTPQSIVSNVTHDIALVAERVGTFISKEIFRGIPVE